MVFYHHWTANVREELCKISAPGFSITKFTGLLLEGKTSQPTNRKPKHGAHYMSHKTVCLKNKSLIFFEGEMNHLSWFKFYFREVT